MSATDTSAALSLDGLTPDRLWLRRVMFGAMYIFLASTYVSIAANSISLGVMALTWIAMMVLDRRLAITSTPLDYFFLSFVLVEIVSTIFSSDPFQSLVLSRRVLLIGIVYLCATMVTTERFAKSLMIVLLGAAALVATLGVAKLVFADPVSTIRLGIFQFYMTTAGLMMIAMLLVLPFAVHAGTPWHIRIAAIVALLPIMISLYATVTRGAYLAVAAGIVFIALVKNKKLILILVLLIVLMIVIAPPYVEKRVQSMVDLRHPENASRLVLWKAGLHIFLDHPIIGVGDIDLGNLLVQYAGSELVERTGHLHNVMMQILVNFGLLGFVVVIAMFVKIFMTEWAIYQRTKDDWFRGSVSLGALTVFVGFQINGLTEWSFGDQEVVVMLWTTVGLALAVGGLHTHNSQSKQ
jgi:O-antigen ligase